MSRFTRLKPRTGAPPLRIRFLRQQLSVRREDVLNLYSTMRRPTNLDIHLQFVAMFRGEFYPLERAPADQLDSLLNKILIAWRNRLQFGVQWHTTDR